MPQSRPKKYISKKNTQVKQVEEVVPAEISPDELVLQRSLTSHEQKLATDLKEVTTNVASADKASAVVFDDPMGSLVEVSFEEHEDDVLTQSDSSVLEKQKTERIKSYYQKLCGNTISPLPANFSQKQVNNAGPIPMEINRTLDNTTATSEELAVEDSSPQ
jgi:hypothetical protein